MNRIKSFMTRNVFPQIQNQKLITRCFSAQMCSNRDKLCNCKKQSCEVVDLSEFAYRSQIFIGISSAAIGGGFLGVFKGMEGFFVGTLIGMVIANPLMKYYQMYYIRPTIVSLGRKCKDDEIRNNADSLWKPY